MSKKRCRKHTLHVVRRIPVSIASSTTVGTNTVHDNTTNTGNMKHTILEIIKHVSKVTPWNTHIFSYVRHDNQYPPTHALSFVCNVCKSQSRVQCKECGGGVHASCGSHAGPITPSLGHDGSYLEGTCFECFTLRQSKISVGPVCKICNEQDAVSTFAGMRCERCCYWYHETCLEISRVRVCDRHGIGNDDACINRDNGRCISGSWVSLCSDCVDMM
jgi:hypothetical protein